MGMYGVTLTSNSKRYCSNILMDLSLQLHIDIVMNNENNNMIMIAKMIVTNIINVMCPHKPDISECFTNLI